MKQFVDRCVCCFLPKSDHHDYEPLYLPDGCKCEPMIWGNPFEIPNVCRNFIQDQKQMDDFCKYCQHPSECHEILRD